MRTRLWLCCAVLSPILLVVYYVVPPLSGWYLAVWLGVTVLAAAAIPAGIRLHRLRRVTAWYFLLAGHLLNTTGNAVYAWLVLHDRPTEPSIADLGFVAGSIAVVTSLVLMAHARIADGDRGVVVDSAIVATSAALLSWTFVMRPIALDSTSDVLSRITDLSYPVTDIFLLAVLAFLAASSGVRGPSFWLLGGAVAVTLQADVAYAIVSLAGSTATGWLAGGWVVGPILYALSVLHPSAGALTEPAQVRRTPLTGRRLLVLTLTSLVAPLLLIGQGLTSPAGVDWAGIGAGCIVLFLLVIARMWGLVRQVRSQSDQLDLLAHSDGLTGVPNRRAWDLRLAAVVDDKQRQTVHVAILDLDHFKRFNDENGHQAGDELLREVAQIWRSALRQTDFLARYGGEEFTLLVEGASDPTVLEALERLRERMPGTQTFSCGVARWDRHETGRELVERADTALYEAKAAGRDRVVFDLYQTA